MIKILINNEEVVCKNNIKIDEKMLSTSSTILKNCYPLSWENDKDYTTRFYFPEDYSKCKIIEEKEVSNNFSNIITINTVINKMILTIFFFIFLSISMPAFVIKNATQALIPIKA